MEPAAIIGCSLAGATAGGVLGLYVGVAHDRSDFPFLPVIYTPMGAAIGAIAGSVTGALMFA
jgi:uncharacterized membrane protein